MDTLDTLKRYMNLASGNISAALDDGSLEYAQKILKELDASTDKDGIEIKKWKQESKRREDDINYATDYSTSKVENNEPIPDDIKKIFQLNKLSLPKPLDISDDIMKSFNIGQAKLEGVLTDETNL